jgi:hypothetical protein
MKFKDDKLKQEFWDCDPRLQKEILEFEDYSTSLFGIEPFMTCLKRMYDKKQPSVHGLLPCCGCDLRIQPKDKSIPPMYTVSQVAAIKYHMNNMFDYGDGLHQSCIDHDTGSGYHWHLQCKPLVNSKENEG